MVANDLMAASGIEIKWRAWHVRRLMFMISRPSGREMSISGQQFARL
jgi:hypothetical protein